MRIYNEASKESEIQIEALNKAFNVAKTPHEYIQVCTGAHVLGRSRLETKVFKEGFRSYRIN